MTPFALTITRVRTLLGSDADGLTDAQCLALAVAQLASHLARVDAPAPAPRPGDELVIRRDCREPFPPRFDAVEYPRGTIVQVIATQTQKTARYESNGGCWRSLQPKANGRLMGVRADAIAV